LAVKPGGWLLIEDAHWYSAIPVCEAEGGEAFRRVEASCFKLATMAGWDGDGALRLPRLLKSHPLAYVGNLIGGAVVEGGPTGRLWMHLAVEQPQESAHPVGWVSSQGMERYLARWDDPERSTVPPLLVSARVAGSAREPAEGT